MSNAIELGGVWYRAGPDFELSDVSMTVPAGSVYGFLGANGSGKTTTIRLLVGLHKADRGSVRVLGKSVPEDLPAILQGTGYVPEKSHRQPASRCQWALPAPFVSMATLRGWTSNCREASWW